MMLLVFGATGQVARELARHVPQGAHLHALDRAAADLGDPQACARIVRDCDADVIVNAAAYTAVDRAEADEDAATVINAAAPTAMAQAAAKKGVPFLHISTDYVFDGTGTEPFTPDAATGPLGVYGRSKLAGENGIRGAGGVHVILRTAWVFSAHGNNFVKTMLRLGAERPTLSVVGDQIGGPTAAADIAAALMGIAQQLHAGKGQGGTYHFSGAPDVSWADFAREIFAQAGLACVVKDIPTSDYPTPARRPPNSKLDCSSLATAFGISRPDWRRGLAQVLAELKSTG